MAIGCNFNYQCITDGRRNPLFQSEEDLQPEVEDVGVLLEVVLEGAPRVVADVQELQFSISGDNWESTITYPDGATNKEVWKRVK